MPDILRRFAFGCVWFVIFWLGLSTIGGGIAGAMTSGGNPLPHASLEQRFDHGYRTGSAAGIDFEQHYGHYVKLASLILATTGTLAGILPGTAARKKTSDS